MNEVEVPAHPHTIGVIYFGKELDWVYQYWHAQVMKVAPDANLVMMTDEQTVLPQPLMPHLRFGLKEHTKFIRPRFATMDRKEVLAFAAMLCVPGSLLLLDVDAIVQKDPFQFLHHEADTESWGMARDPFPRRAGEAVEHNAGVLYFPPNCERTALASLWMKCWDELHAQGCDGTVLLGQKTWSLAHARSEGFMLDNRMNWSHVWGSKEEAAVVHYHGPRGKDKLRNRIALEAASAAGPAQAG